MNEPGTATGASVTLRCSFCLKLNRLDISRAGDRPKCGECGRPFLLDRPVKIAGEDLERVVAEAEVPILVDFYADWCGPCKMLKPTIRELARDYAGKVAVAAVNVDKQGVLANKYGIQSIPDVKAFKDGEVAETLIGLRNKPDYAATLDKLLQ